MCGNAKDMCVVMRYDQVLEIRMLDVGCWSSHNVCRWDVGSEDICMYACMHVYYRCWMYVNKQLV